MFGSNLRNLAKVLGCTLAVLLMVGGVFAAERTLLNRPANAAVSADGDELYPNGWRLQRAQMKTLTPYGAVESLPDASTVWDGGDINVCARSQERGLFTAQYTLAVPFDPAVPLSLEVLEIPYLATIGGIPSLGMEVKICDDYSFVDGTDPCAGTVLYFKQYVISNAPLAGGFAYNFAVPFVDALDVPTPLVLDDRVGGGVDPGDPDIVIQIRYTYDDGTTCRGAGTCSPGFFCANEPGLYDVGGSVDPFLFRDQDDSGTIIVGPVGSDTRPAINGIGSKWAIHLFGAQDSVGVFTYGSDYFQTTGCSSFTVPADPGDPAAPGYPWSFASFDFGDDGTDCTADSGGLNSDGVPPGTVIPVYGLPMASNWEGDPSTPQVLGGNVDTILDRFNSAKFSGSGSRFVPANVYGLNLQSSAPVTVTRGGGAVVETWDVKWGFSDTATAGAAEVDYYQNACFANRGDADVFIQILPKIQYTRVSGGGPCTITYDFGPGGQPSVILGGSTTYAQGDVAPLGLLQEPFGLFSYDSNLDGLFTEGGIVIPWASTGSTLATAAECDDCSSTALVSTTMTLSGAGYNLVLKSAFPYDTDSDGDAVNDAQSDADGDLVFAGGDNCPSTSNGCQEDGDFDGAGDACDNCPLACNADQADADGDGPGDACDECPNDAGADPDGDGVCTSVDNCPGTANPDQADSDGDGEGDLCDIPTCADGDNDNDGICNGVDNCVDVANADQADEDGDGYGDACDACPRSDLRPEVIIGKCKSKAGNDLLSDGCTIADKIAACKLNSATRAQYVSCVVTLLLQLRADGVITGKEMSKLLKCALRKKDHDSRQDHQSHSSRDDASHQDHGSDSNSKKGHDDKSNHQRRNHGRRG